MGGVLVLAAVVGCIIALTSLAYIRARGDDPGPTSEVALISSPLLGALAVSYMLLASGTAVLVAVVLAAKGAAHLFVNTVFTEKELSDDLNFVIATIAGPLFGTA